MTVSNLRTNSNSLSVLSFISAKHEWTLAFKGGLELLQFSYDANVASISFIDSHTLTLHIIVHCPMWADLFTSVFPCSTHRFSSTDWFVNLGAMSWLWRYSCNLGPQRSTLFGRSKSGWVISCPLTSTASFQAPQRTWWQNCKMQSGRGSRHDDKGRPDQGGSAQGGAPDLSQASGNFTSTGASFS